MDLGLTGRRAIVCGASKGLGFACAEALAREGVAVTLVARSSGRLHEASEVLRSQGASVAMVVADVATDHGRCDILRACPAPDILINNAGGPPRGDFRAWDREQWIAALDLNMISGILLMREVVDGMIDRGFGRIVNITSSAVKAPIPMLGLSNGARSGLTGFAAGLARQTAAHNVTINNLLPGMFLTDRLQSLFDASAEARGGDRGAFEDQERRKIPAGRFGAPSEFGDLCAFVCSAQAGYLTGQNLLLDGGLYPGTF